jgi:hypothetical protein
MSSGKDEEVFWQQFHNDDRFRPVVWDPLNPEVEAVYAEEMEESDCNLDSAVDMGAGEREDKTKSDARLSVISPQLIRHRAEEMGHVYGA